MYFLKSSLKVLLSIFNRIANIDLGKLRYFNELKCKNNKKENDENDERENHNEKPNAESEKEAEELAKFTLQLTKQLKDIATGKFMRHMYLG